MIECHQVSVFQNTEDTFFLVFIYTISQIQKEQVRLIHHSIFKHPQKSLPEQHL